MKSNLNSINNIDDYSNGISKIKEFLKKITEFLKENKLFIAFFVIALILLGGSYLYSENYRINSKTNDVLNTLVYSEPREMIDFCGIDNKVADKMFTSVIFNTKENTMKVLNENINLFDLGITSEYIFYIKGNGDKDFYNEGFFNVERVLTKNTVKFDNTKKIKIAHENEEDITAINEEKSNFDSYVYVKQVDNIEIIYYRPNSKINPYKFRKLTDYYISSSHKSPLIGFQKADYCSLDMINRVIFLGARYIELEIFNKEIKNETIPVVSSGYSKGNLKLTLNYIELKDCLDLVAQMAFSESHINNFNDPFFIFFNLKVDGNINTLNLVAQMIKEKLGNRLLSKKYLNTNLGNASLCELKKKAVIFSSSGWKGSELEDVVNSSTDSPYLQRLTQHEVLNYKERSKPKAIIRKNSIRFKKGSPNAIIEFVERDVDLTKLGITNTDNIVIEGAKNMENNTGNFLFKIDNFSSNSIMLDKNVKLVNEAPDSMVSISFFDKSYIGEHITLEEYNKNNLTICVPDDKMLSTNYNYKNAMWRGCQFVTMNYQSLDNHMKNYFNLFMKRAFQFKPSTLIHNVDLPVDTGLSSLIPDEKVSLDYDVDYSFINKYANKTIIISAGQFSDLNLGLNEMYLNAETVSPPANMILDGKTDEIELLVKRGLDGRDDTVSFMLINNRGNNTKKFLRYYENCCYLTFDSKLSNKHESYDQFYEKEKETKMSFIPLKSLTRDNRFNSFGVIMKKSSGDVIYYLKHNKNFSPKYKIFTKFTNSYKFKMFLIENPTGEINNIDNYVAILRPYIPINYKFLALGDIIVPLRELSFNGKDSGTLNIDNILLDVYQPNIKTMVINGAVSHPIEYELVFENRYFKDSEKKIHYETSAQLSIWKPIPRDGYTAMGFVFQNGYSKPKLEEIYCVSNDYIKEQVFDKDYYINIFDHSNSSINIWKNNIGDNNSHGLNYYATVKNVRQHNDDFTDNNRGLTPPNPFDFPQNTINLSFNEYNDRIYIDNIIENTKKDKQSCNFEIKLSSNKFKITTPNKVDHLLKLDSTDSKLISTQKSKGGNNICVGLPQAYWSSYYKEVNSNLQVTDDSNINSKLKGMACGENSNFGTNFRLYSDHTIRLSNNNKYCMTHQPDSNGKINKDIQSDQNFLYIDRCKPDFKNQLFTIEEQRIKVMPDGGSDENACLTLTPENDLRLEECGDQKFTSLYLWDNEIMRDDKCLKSEAVDILKEASTIEKCEDNSFYVIYLQGIFKNKEFCTKQDALSEYNSLYSNRDTEGIAGIIIGHKNQVIKKTMDEVPPPFLNEMNFLTSKKGTCYTCEFPSRMLCTKQRMENTIYNSFNNFEEEQRLVKYCMNMKDNRDIRCGRSSRQKFVNFPVPEDFCLSAGNMVYVQFPEIINSESNLFNNQTQRTNINKLFERSAETGSADQLPVENLLDEYYSNNYSVFIPALLKTGNSLNKYKLLFQTSGMTDNIKNLFTSINIFKTSPYICPDYLLKESMLKVGSKVLVNFDNFYVDGDGTNNSPRSINKNNIKYFGVIIKKMSDKIYRVMLSINSYESNFKRNPKIGVKHYTTNPIKDYFINNITLLKQADVCL